MSNLFTERVLNMAAVTPQPEDYTGEDGLLYCGKCQMCIRDRSYAI